MWCAFIQLESWHPPLYDISLLHVRKNTMSYIGFVLHAQGIMKFVVFVYFKTMYTYFSIQFELHLILPVATSKTLNINQVIFSSKLYGIVWLMALVYLLLLQCVTLWICLVYKTKRYFSVIQQELFTLCETLSAGVDQRLQASGESCDAPQLVMDPGRLLKLLQICTLITQGKTRFYFLLMCAFVPLDVWTPKQGFGAENCDAAMLKELLTLLNIKSVTLYVS